MAQQSNNYWMGIVTGVIVGAGAALLLSLKHHAETQPNLNEGGPSMTEKAASIGAGIVETVTQSAQAIKERGEELVAQARHENEDAFDDPSDFLPIESPSPDTPSNPNTTKTDEAKAQAHDVIDSV